MNYRDAADWMGQRPAMLLAIGWGAAVTVGLARLVVWPLLQPKRPVAHGPEYLASKAKSDASMARAFGTPKEP